MKIKNAKGENVRLKTSLSEEMEGKLNKQVQMEGISSFYYLTMASWCESKGYQGAAQFLYNHTEEEKVHMLKLMHFINDSGGYALAPEIKNLKYQYASLREIFEDVLQHEIHVTKAINGIADYCHETKDFMTLQFLQWYITEQHEEELVARRLLEFFDIIGEEGQGLWLIDQEIGRFAAQLKAADTQTAA